MKAVKKIRFLSETYFHNKRSQEGIYQDLEGEQREQGFSRANIFGATINRNFVAL